MQQEQKVYALYLAYVAEYLRELGVDSRPLFRAAGLADPATIQPGERIPLHTVSDLMRRIHAQVKRPGFSLELGARIPIMAHGTLGNAILACRDAGAVLELIERYVGLVLPGVRFTRTALGKDIAVGYEIAPEWQELGSTIVEALIGTTIHNMAQILGQPFLPKRVSLSYAAPAHAARYAELTGCAVTFGAAQNQMVYTRDQLALPIRTANSLSQRLILRQCEDELREVQAGKPLSERIREVLRGHLETSPSIGFVAAQLKLSERTLRRHLSSEGIHFRELLQQVRLDAATHYLSNTQLQVEQIAQRLGYSETANFRKAFKQHTGHSPRAWRAQQGSA